MSKSEFDKTKYCSVECQRSGPVCDFCIYYDDFDPRYGRICAGEGICLKTGAITDISWGCDDYVCSNIRKGMAGARGAIVVVPEKGGGFSAEIPSLPGCMTCAETWEEVWTMIQDAKSCWLQAAFPARRSLPGDGQIKG